LKIFLSSTDADLKDIRAELREYLPSLGYDVVCYENVDFKKSSGKCAHDICLDNVKDCDIYLLIIAERFGDTYNGSDLSLSDRSVTWAEYDAAVHQKKTICIFVRRTIWLEKATYRWNKDRGIEIVPYYAKDKRVFEFIEYLASRTVDNWIDQYEDVVELKQKIKFRLANLK
jgi:hypothetical protein